MQSLEADLPTPDRMRALARLYAALADNLRDWYAAHSGQPYGETAPLVFKVHQVMLRYSRAEDLDTRALNDINGCLQSLAEDLRFKAEELPPLWRVMRPSEQGPMAPYYPLGVGVMAW